MRADRAARFSPRLVPLLVAAVAAFYAVIAWRTGVRTSPDSATYSRWADLLIADHFNIASYLNEQSFVVPPVLYLLWIVVVATAKAVLGSHWMAGIVVVNWLSLISGVGSTLGTVRRLTGSTTAVALATAMFFVAGDLMIFVPYVLSDLIFWALSAAVLAIGISAASGIRGQSASPLSATLIGTALVVTAFAFRPAALPLFAFWLIALLHVWFPDFVNGRERWLVAALIVLAAMAVGVHAYFLTTPSAWPLGAPPGMLVLLAKEYREGVLVYSPNNDMLVRPAADFAGFVLLTLQKLGYFLTPWLPHYSRFHALINAAFFLPVYGLAALAVARGRRLQPPARIAIWLSAGYVLLVSLFHALVQIDYDHRYRLPILPALIIMSASGFATARQHRTSASTAQVK